MREFKAEMLPADFGYVKCESMYLSMLIKTICFVVLQIVNT